MADSGSVEQDEGWVREGGARPALLSEAGSEAELRQMRLNVAPML